MDDVIIITSNSCILRYLNGEYIINYSIRSGFNISARRINGGGWDAVDINTLPNTLKMAVIKMKCKIINGFK